MGMQISTNSPDNILSVEFKELFSLVELGEKDRYYGINKKQKYTILNCILDHLGMDSNNELTLGVLSQPKKELVIACAGSGKTTMAHIKIIFMKVMSQLYAALSKTRGEEFYSLLGVDMLFLVYNTHNVEPVLQEHVRLCSRLNARNMILKLHEQVIPIQIDTKLNVMTFHSLAKTWVDEYKNEFSLAGFNLIENEGPFVNIMATSSQVNCRKFDVSFKRFKPFALYQAYVLCKETMVDITRLVDEPLSELCPRVELEDIDGELLYAIFAGFERSKKSKRYLSFTDYLVFFHKLLSEYPEARERIAARYDFFVADEYQDFNNIMVESLKLLVGEKNLFCIGDDDQAIYGFRGVDIASILNFRQYYEDGRVYTLSINRRCAKEIVDAASFMVNHNTMRYKKSIKTQRDGGLLKFYPYITEEGATKNIIARLKKMDRAALNRTVICYKNRIQSAIMSYELFKAGIPFTVSSGIMPMDNLIFRDFLEVLNLLALPNDREKHRFISYVTCMSEDAANAIVGYDGYRRLYKKPLTTEFHFKNEDYGKYTNNQKFLGELAMLIELSDKLRSSTPMCEYVDQLIDLYLKNHINWRQEEDAEQNEVTGYFTHALTEYYSKPVPYREFYKEHQNRVKQLQLNNESKQGVLLSTFHGLKGLEKDIVIGIGLDESIYPAQSLIELNSSGPEQAQLLLEEEMRLFYVLLTRARDKVYLFYQKNRPSLFVQMLIDGAEEWQTPKEEILIPAVGCENTVSCSGDNVSLRRRFGGVFGD